ncbi:MAG: HPr(Ser) kinase/phosphatase [Oscillospiraceae bacterium]|nr:HPr(Ser) kinase/phosphatase [Oscillospiraceae bacterium]
MESGNSVSLQVIVEEFKLKVVRGDTQKVKVTRPIVNRPGLQLVGFYDYFDNDRVQLLGRMEWTYLTKLTTEERAKCFDDLFSRPIPAVIVARNQEIFPECLAAAEKYDRVLLLSERNTARLQTDLINALTRHLAPCITRHGVLVEVYGEGVLLMGESGVGKSETAVELIKRGHRLIADDAVEIRRVAANTLVGMAPELIRYYVELRGIGVIDVRRLFGMASVKDSQEINLIINMELWKDGMLYDRLGLENRFTSIMDVELPTLTIPVKPGRNLAVIIETAAMNNRDKKMGYNAAKEFTDQINAHFDQQLANNQRM